MDNKPTKASTNWWL